MTHPRSQMRSALRLAFDTHPDFSTCTQISAWAQNVDAETLPVLAVATPREAKDLDALDSAERATTIIVILKRRGGDDIEDTLDLDSDTIETLVLGTLRTLQFGTLLETTDVVVDGAGEQRVGSLTMTFRVVRQAPEP